MSFGAKETHIGAFGVVFDESSSSRGRRRAPEYAPSSECCFRIQKKHVDPPTPQNFVSRRRTTSAPPAVEEPIHNQKSSKRHASLHAETSERVFPTSTEKTSISRATSARSILSWEGCDRVAAPPQRRSLRSASIDPAVKEFSIKSLTGERRHVDPPGQVHGGLFNVLTSDNHPPSRARPILRQKNNCVSHGEGPKPKPCRLMRKCSGQSHDRGFTFLDSAVVPLSRPNA
jgi:hypothetical protein